MIICLVAAAHMIDQHVLKQGGKQFEQPLSFYFSNEGSFILENATRIGLPVPNRIKQSTSVKRRYGRMRTTSKEKVAANALESQYQLTVPTNFMVGNVWL